MNRAVYLLVTSSLLWSLAGLLIKWVQWNPMAIAGGRSAIAAVTIWALMPRGRIHFSRQHLGAAVAYALTVALFVVANKLTTAANAIFLQFTAPVYVALFGAWFLGEHPRRIDWLLIGVALIGILLFFGDHLTAGGMAGNLFGLGSGMAFAALVILLRKQKDGSPVESVLLGNILTALAGLPFMFAEAPSARTCLGIVILGALQLGLPYFLYSIAIKHVRALDTLLIGMMEPVLNPLWVYLVHGERPQPWALTGGVLVLAAALVRGVLTLKGHRTRSPMMPT